MARRLKPALRALILVFLPIILVFPPRGEARPKTIQNRNIASPPGGEAIAPPLGPRARAATPAGLSVPADTFLLGEFTFETGGVADPQGWTSHDLTSQVDRYFHVADTTELDGGPFGSLEPLAGEQSLWCGVAPSSSPPYCGYASLPGYGNDWNQRFESVAFPVEGDVTLSYRIRWDSEPGYDWTVVQYADTNGVWKTLPVDGGAGKYEGVGDLTEAFVIASAAVGDSLRVRFRFMSDCCWSDEDGLYSTEGALLLDSLTVSDASGTVDYQDFESESLGDLATADGDWSAGTGPEFGDFAALYTGASVLQEDPCLTNTSFFWGFFDDPAITHYWCYPQHPEQGGIRGGYYVDGYSGCLEIDNQIWSPLIPLTGTGDEINLSFTVYRDLTLDGLIFYQWHVRSWVNGCPGPWQNESLYYGATKEWTQKTWPIGSLIDPDATHIQIALGVLDKCGDWGIFGCGDYEACHTQGPLFDDVRVERIDFPGPQFDVNHANLFQDNFSEDGTITGVARADCARDINSYSTPTIRPGDSLSVGVGAPTSGLSTDPFTGVGPAVYAYVSVLPAGKSGPVFEAPETGAIGKRYPLVDSLTHGGAAWYCFRMDSVRTPEGIEADRYCFDLADDVFTPGDTVLYVLGAEANSGHKTYWSRTYGGCGEDFVTAALTEALDSPCEFTILPAGGWARGGDILLVDASDDRGGPAQIYFDTAFDMLQLDGRVDRYDVLAPASWADNTLASRVKDVATQISGCYRKILWCSGNMSIAMSDGTGSPGKSDDYQLLLHFLDSNTDNRGLYLSGDDLTYRWGSSVAPSAANLQSTYMNFGLLSDDHVASGEPEAPVLTLGSAVFGGDTLIAYGGCPQVNKFDVLFPAGSSVSEADYPNGAGAAILSQATTTSDTTTARVVLSGFGYNYIADVTPGGTMARVEHLRDILTWFQNTIAPPTGAEPRPRFANFLDNAYPNPFNPETTIRYGVKERGRVSIKIYNVEGKLVRTLVDEVKVPQAGGFAARWDGRNESNETVASGVYFYRLKTRSFIQTRKMVLLK